jgi:hypothetical protein
MPASTPSPIARDLWAQTRSNGPAPAASPPLMRWRAAAAGRFRQIGISVEMDQREQTMFFGVRLECWIGRKMISAQTKRGHVLSTSLLHRLDHILRSSRGRRDVNGGPALIVEADIA